MLERLRSALADRYLIERELGGGGMARVFLAEERALGRRVVIKALPPDIAAGISAERFRREVQLAASLQHPHIVPVLAAGDADGLLWYSMPHVEGQSLRGLLEREGPLPPAQATRLLRDMADALEHAHAKGLVHRDIKPENVLLSGTHAVITDFGIAKALATARQSGDSGQTTEGLVIGTPAYMAPEQAAGDARLDQRADLYALGAVGYEMLAGGPLFNRPTPQALIAAHIAETPVPLEKARPGVPHQLSQLIMLCLAKDPGRRPTAFAVRTSLEALGPAATGARRRRRVLVTAGILALLVVTSVATGFWPRRSLVARGVLEDHDRILVAAVENRTPDSTLGLALTQALRVDLTQSDVVRVVGDQEIRAALARAQRPPDAPLDDALAREIAQREGIKAIVLAEVSPVGEGYLLTARVVAPGQPGDLVAVRQNAANAGQVLEALGRLSRDLRRRVGESLRSIAATPSLERVTTGSLEALRNYSLGVHAADVARDPRRAISLLQEAIARDSGFAMAWRKLGIIHSNAGRRAEAVAALNAAYRFRERLSGPERGWTEATYFGTVTIENDKAIAAYRGLIEADSLDWRAMNNLALIYSRDHRPEIAESLLRQALKLDSSRVSPYVNLAEVLVTQGKNDEAERILALAQSRFPGEPSVAWGDLQASYARGGGSAADRVVARLAPLVRDDIRARADLATVMAALSVQDGALKAARVHLETARRATLEAGDLEKVYDIVFSEAMSFVTVGQPDQAVRVLEEAIRRHPVDSLDLVDRPYLDLAFIYSLAGRLDRAGFWLDRFDQIPAILRRRDQSFYDSILAMIAMQQGRFEEALRKNRSAFRLEAFCPTCTVVERAWIFDRAGRTDSAIVTYRQFLTMPHVNRVYTDGYVVPNALLRLAELYDERGDAEEAREFYGRFVDLWRNADREMQPRVSAARRRLAELTGEP